MAQATDYILDSTESERDRLSYQAALVAPESRRLLTEAGIGAGQRVLDLGSGVGDLALLAAEFVGPTGTVRGIDRDPAQTAHAQGRADALGLDQVRFETSDLMSYHADMPFDAVIGRFVLVHNPHLDAMIDHVASLVRPGGVLAFHEIQAGPDWRIAAWPEHITPAGVAAGVAVMQRMVAEATGGGDLAWRLPASLARLGQVKARYARRIEVGRDAVHRQLDYLAETVGSAIRHAVAFGMAREGEFDVATMKAEIAALMARPEAECVTSMAPPEVLAFVRLPD